MYYVSLRGVTGAANLNLDEVRSRIAEIQTQSKLPVGVGFGIDSPTAAAAVAEFADAVIVGSALVRVVAENADDTDALIEKASSFAGDLNAAVKQARA